MPARYQKELKRLEGVYQVAKEMEIAPLCAVVERWANRPMAMVGSGGSFSTAVFAANLHETATGQLAHAETPLETMSKEKREAGLVCFSANGRNQDILNAFTVAGTREMDPLSAIVLAEHTLLQKLGNKFRYSDVVCMGHQLFKDGFLAVASLVGFSILLVRAYRSVFGHSEKDIPESVTELIRFSTSFSKVEDISAEVEYSLRGRGHVSVLYSSELAAAAIDLESRFVEAALGSLHIADLRNFGHGRHFWMAKKARETVVLAMISEGQRGLGKRTLSSLPEELSILPIHFHGSKDIQGLAGFIVGLFASEGAARLTDVDPGKPGVPQFGRRLYHLKSKFPKPRQVELNRAAALRRKGASVDDQLWISHYECAIDKVNSAHYEALVLDYDGTLCDTRNRTGPIDETVVKELTRLGDEGAVLGLATGRGPSAGIELRASLPSRLHDRILVGYYNGAVTRYLSDQQDPLVENLCQDNSLTAALKSAPLLNGKLRLNSVQISTGVREGARLEEGAEIVRFLMSNYNVKGDTVISGHSIDVCLSGQSKEDVLQALQISFGLKGEAVLRIGDRGRPPGNDWKLLDNPYGLSVDEVSAHPMHCWSLSPAGAKGIQATVHYLRNIKWSSRGGRLQLSSASRL